MVLTTGPVGISTVPQLSVTTGRVGITIFAAQATVALVGVIAAKGSLSMVTVCDHTWLLPSQSV